MRANKKRRAVPGVHRTILTGLAFVFVLSGCSGARLLMPVPTVYTRAPLAQGQGVESPAATDTLDVLYVTDRTPRGTDKGAVGQTFQAYSFGRSRSLAFGVSQVKVSRRLNASGEASASLTLGNTTELGCAPPTPWPVSKVDGRVVVVPTVAREIEVFAESLRADFANSYAPPSVRR